MPHMPSRLIQLLIKKLKETDAYLAMYHDQALPVLKAMSFGEAINITLGTSIVRTSVDHGTALDVAGKLKPNRINKRSD